MKPEKIIFPAIIALAIAFFVIKARGCGGEICDNCGVCSKCSKRIFEIVNQYVDDIERQISELGDAPVNVFSAQTSKSIENDINDCYDRGFLGDGDESLNEMQKNRLSRNLFVAYASKFITQAEYVFRRSEWTPAAISTIRTENRRLLNDPLMKLPDNDEPRKELQKIQEVLRQYDQMQAFVERCGRFRASGYALDEYFPISSVQSMIDSAQRFRNTAGLIRNCSRLQTELANVPQVLFDEHVRYLKEKIRQNSGNRIEEKFEYQSQYMSAIYAPLNNQITALNNSVYNISQTSFNDGKTELTRRWQAEGTRVTNTF